MNPIFVEIISNFDVKMIESMAGHPKIQGEVFAHDIFSTFYLYLRKDEKEIALQNLKKEALELEKDLSLLPSIIKDDAECLRAFKEKLKDYQSDAYRDALEAYYLKEVEGVFEP